MSYMPTDLPCTLGKSWCSFHGRDECPSLSLDMLLFWSLLSSSTPSSSGGVFGKLLRLLCVRVNLNSTACKFLFLFLFLLGLRLHFPSLPEISLPYPSKKCFDNKLLFSESTRKCTSPRKFNLGGSCSQEVRLLVALFAPRNIVNFVNIRQRKKTGKLVYLLALLRQPGLYVNLLLLKLNPFFAYHVKQKSSI